MWVLARLLGVLWFLYFVLGGLGAQLSISQQETPFFGQSNQTATTYTITAPAFSEKIENITTQFGTYGLQSITVCVRPFLRTGDGGIWDFSNTTSYCTTMGCTTCNGETTTNKFTPDEWAVNVTICQGDGYLQFLRMDTNLGNYWIAGNYSNCEKQPTNYSTSGPINGITANITQIGNSELAISAISFIYFTCTGADCPSNGYNGGGVCAIKNGGCDEHTSCDNENGCSACPSGFSGTGDTICIPNGVIPANPIPAYTFSTTLIGLLGPLFGTEYSATPYTYKLSRIRTYYSYTSSYFMGIDVCFRTIKNGEYDGAEDCSSTLGNTDNVDMNLQLDADKWVASVVSCADLLTRLRWMKFILNNGTSYTTGDNTSCFSYATIPVNSFSALVGVSAFSLTLLDINILCGISIVVATCVSDCPPVFYSPPISSCLVNNGGCGEYAVCSDTGNITCECYPGYYVLNSTIEDTEFGFNTSNSCVEIDLCAETHPCVDDTQCTQEKPNFFTCGACPSGFVGSGYTQCQDIDECIYNNNCSENATCINLLGNYSCNCNEGYQGDGFTCGDFDECLWGTDECDENANCINIFGSYLCVCLGGFTGDGFTCTDINECRLQTDNCSSLADCTNTPGSFLCNCESGFSGDGYNCTDIDECEDKTICDPDATCTNTFGSYDCRCNRGFTGNGTVCSDLNECLGRTNCSLVGGQCINLEGSFMCICKTGYQGNGYICTDVNECVNDTHACDEHATCANYIGGYSCTCDRGYEGDGHNCTDINECAQTKTNNCSTFATCTNSPGSFSCACSSGFSGDGYSCQDINECLQSTSPCNLPFLCHNSIGSFSCDCPSGYFQQNDTCQDINECETNNGGCDMRVTCTNTLGSRLCGDCPLGFIGSGNTTCRTLCGDGICDFRFEDCVTCPKDCTTPTCNICGDGFCNTTTGETCSTCFDDCGPCSSECKPSCDHGKCVDGFCVCYGNWTGPSCSTDQNNPIEVNVTLKAEPAVSLTSSVLGEPLQFTLAIKGIVELDSENSVVGDVPMSNINFTLTEDGSGGNRVFNFCAVLENRAVMHIGVYIFENSSTTMDFADAQTAYAANSVKLSIRVREWPFKAITNSIGIVLDSTYMEKFAADVSCVNYQLDQSGNLRWVMVSINGASLYGQFLDKVVVDGRIRKVTYQLSNTTITAILPFFNFYADMDPDFSILLGDENGKCRGKQGESKNILEIVVPTVLGLALLACIIIVSYPKVKYWWYMRNNPGGGEGGGGLQEVLGSTEMSEIQLE